ncbi:MAG: hypothetical protein KME09_00225 [Pleurocapsa minor HA4230-MV1]|jgi:hypothetical protein|nr:hypothetical protein [Pleurocapsa minor HA4230-MV1]
MKHPNKTDEIKIENEGQTATSSNTNSIYIVGGEKGGVGKSFFSRCLIEYFIAKNWSNLFTFVEADQSIDDIIPLYRNFCTDSIAIQFSDNKYDQDQADKILTQVSKKTVLLNLPSNISSMFDAWVERSGLTTLEFKEYCSNIVYFFVTDGCSQSVERFLAQLKKYPAQSLYHCLVFNPGRCTSGGDFRYLENSCPELLKAILDNQIPILKLPEMTPSQQFSCDRQKIPYVELKESNDFRTKRNGTVLIDKLEKLFNPLFDLNLSSVEGLAKIVEEQKVHRESKSLQYLYG